MQLASSILAALLTCTPSAPATSPSETLAVQVNLAFDPSIASPPIQAAVREEAAAIWRAYGVELMFTDGGTRAALAIDVMVENGPRRRKRDDLPEVLGRTEVAPAPAPPAPVRISFNAIEALLERQHGVTQLLHDYMISVALGRVMAHEIGHILLGTPTYHDVDGLMRTTFFPDDLARPERSRFRLTDRSIARLKTRVASLAEAQSNESCARTIR
jgi:hypothetical protein